MLIHTPEKLDKLAKKNDQDAYEEFRKNSIDKINNLISSKPVFGSSYFVKLIPFKTQHLNRLFSELLSSGYNVERYSDDDDFICGIVLHLEKKR